MEESLVTAAQQAGFGNVTRGVRTMIQAYASSGKLAESTEQVAEPAANQLPFLCETSPHQVFDAAVRAYSKQKPGVIVRRTYFDLIWKIVQTGLGEVEKKAAKVDRHYLRRILEAGEKDSLSDHMEKAAQAQRWFTAGYAAHLLGIHSVLSLNAVYTSALRELVTPNVASQLLPLIQTEEYADLKRLEGALASKGLSVIAEIGLSNNEEFSLKQSLILFWSSGSGFRTFSHSEVLDIVFLLGRLADEGADADTSLQFVNVERPTIEITVSNSGVSLITQKSMRFQFSHSEWSRFKELFQIALASSEVRERLEFVRRFVRDI